MTASEAERAALIAFLSDIARPGQSLNSLADADNLVDHGVIDSLAVIQIILYLETEHGVNLGAAGIDPAEIVSIAGIMRAIGHRR